MSSQARETLQERYERFDDPVVVSGSSAKYYHKAVSNGGQVTNECHLQLETIMVRDRAFAERGKQQCYYCAWGDADE